MSWLQLSENSKAAWPAEQAETVRKKAEKEGHNRALETLAMIQHQLFGNADRMEELATGWGETDAITDSKIAVDTSRSNLAGYWEGGGFDSYREFSLTASETMSDNESILNEVSSVLEGCITIVYDTYADAIEFISSCAHDLIEEGSSILDSLNPFSGAGAIIRILNDFADNVAKLIAAAVRKMGELREDGVFLARQANDYTLLNAIPQPAQNDQMWSVKPIPEESA